MPRKTPLSVSGACLFYIIISALSLIILCAEPPINSQETISPIPEESINYEHSTKPTEDIGKDKDSKNMQIVYIKLPLLHVMPENQIVQGRSLGANDEDGLNQSESYRQEASTEPEASGNQLQDDNNGSSNQYSSNSEAEVNLDFSNSPSSSSSSSLSSSSLSSSSGENEQFSDSSDNSVGPSLPRRHIYQPEVHGHFVGPLMGVEEGEKKLQNKPHMNLGILPIIIQIDDNGKMPEITHAQVLQQANTFLGRGQKLNNFVQRNASKVSNQHNSGQLVMPFAPFTPGYGETMTIKPFGMPHQQQQDLNKLNNQFWKNLIQTANNQPMNGHGNMKPGNSFWNNMWPAPGTKSTNNNNNNNKELSLSPNANIQPFGMYGTSSPFVNQYGSVFDWFDAGQSSKMLQQALSSNTNLNYEHAPLPMMSLSPTMITSGAGNPSGSSHLLFRHSPTRQKLRNSALVKSAKSLFSSFSSKGVAGQHYGHGGKHTNHKPGHHHPASSSASSPQGHSGMNNGMNNNANNPNGLLYPAHFGQQSNSFAVHNGNLPVLESNLFASIATSQPSSPLPLSSASSAPCRRPIHSPCAGIVSVGGRHKTPTLQSALALLSPNSIVRKSFVEHGQRME